MAQESSKKAFYRKKIRDLRTANPRSWYQNIKKLMGNDTLEEVIEVDSIKDLSVEEQVERIADKFASVSNLYDPLAHCDITLYKNRFDFLSYSSEKRVKDHKNLILNKFLF